MSFTLGVVPYLNALPLYRTLEVASENPSVTALARRRSTHVAGHAPVRVTRAVPSVLAPRLARGECDVALIPIVEHLRGVGEKIISRACIGSYGAVRSVLLFSRVAPQDISNVAVDSSSRTSVALLRIILSDAHNIAPAFIEHAPDWRVMLQLNHAALLIGDRALEATLENQNEIDSGRLHVLDLGEAWLRLTRLPFVYAAWVSRRGLESEREAELAVLLNAARDEGVRNVGQLACDNVIPTRLSSAQIEDYLRHAITYELSDEYRKGLEEFAKRCRAHGLIATS